MSATSYSPRTDNNLPPNRQMPLEPPPSIPPLPISEDLSLALQLEKQLPAPLQNSQSSLTLPEPPFSPSSSGASTPISPTSPAPDIKPKRQNPLVDLIDTEKVYVELLSGIIRKVAAAWSRANLPPKLLDSVFRAVEAVYKANRAFLNKLNEIGPRPSSPKVLGDLLMKWITDLDGPYTRYSKVYMSEFDVWQPIRENQKLPNILFEFSNNSPPLLMDPTTNDTLWTLDSLLALPRSRLKYYKRLYGRLLKSTGPGRSDYDLLLGANEKLDSLILQLDTRGELKVSDMDGSNPERSDSGVDQARSSTHSSSQASTAASGERLSRETAHTSFSAPPLTDSADIERAVSTAKTLDIFTMKPRQVKLSLNPPGLPFQRQLRISCDAVIHFTPRSDGIERVHQFGHIFLMTDLFLVCERMDETNPKASPEWSLCYPPLAARHLAVSSQGELIIEIQVMKKETLILHMASLSVKEQLLQEFNAAINQASINQPPKPIANGVPGSAPAVTISDAGPSQASGQPLPEMHLSDIGGPQSLSRDISLSSNPSQRGRELNMSPGPEMRQPGPGPGNPFPPPFMMQHPANIPHPSEMAGMPQNFPPKPMGPPSSFPPQGPHMMGPPPPHFGPGPGPGGFGPGMELPPNGMRMNSGLNSAPLDRPPFPYNQGPPRYPPHDMPPRSASRNELASANSQSPFLHKTPSSRSLPAQYQDMQNMPPIPAARPRPQPNGNLALPPSIVLRNSIALGPNAPPQHEISPPTSPTGGEFPTESLTSTISAQMKCKIFLKQQHQQWKSLGSAKLKLYHQSPTNIKQLVVEADTKDHPIIISTIILTDGVERVGKTGVAIELSDKGQRTGIVYMIQLRNEQSATGLFDQLLRGSDRAAINRTMH